MTPPEVYIRGTDRRTLGLASSWVRLDLHALRNDVSRWTLVTRDAATAALLSPPTNAEGRMTGARGVIIRRGGGTIVSGWCDGSPNVTNDGYVTEWTFSGWDDTVIMADALCWPRPLSPIDQQTDRDHVIQGPASNRIRDYFIQNVGVRLAIPGATGGDQLNLGPNRKSRARFRNLLELAQSIAHRDLNFQVRQRDGNRDLFLYQWLPVDKRPGRHPKPVVFSPALGTVHGWSHEFTPATATRVVVGAGGEDEQRGFREFIGHVSEEELAGVRKIEKFEDRRDLSLTDEDDNPSDEWVDEAREDASEKLAEATSRATFTINITGQPGYEYGIDYTVGDLVRAYIDQDANSQPIGLVDDLIDEVTVTWSAEGEQAEIRVGSPDAEATNRPLEWGLRKLGRRVTALETRR